jgi:UDP-N-acetylglucosamine transferase subunit ALG13
MIFVTLGTQDKHFDRLLKAVYKLETDEKIVAQIGSTEFKSSKPKEKFEIHKFLSNEEFEKYMDEARVVITHAGVGTIIYGLKKHKKMIVAARLKKYGEHVNDHQLQILQTFASEGYIIPLENFDDLPKLLEIEFTPKEWKSNNNTFNRKLFEEIYGVNEKYESKKSIS